MVLVLLAVLKAISRHFGFLIWPSQALPSLINAVTLVISVKKYSPTTARGENISMPYTTNFFTTAFVGRCITISKTSSGIGSRVLSATDALGDRI